MYGDNLPATPILPVPLDGTRLTLEGQTLEIHGGVQGDAPDNSYVWIPSIKTVVAGTSCSGACICGRARETPPRARRGSRRSTSSPRSAPPR
jgi:hypothetical protein